VRKKTMMRPRRQPSDKTKIRRELRQLMPNSKLDLAEKCMKSLGSVGARCEGLEYDETYIKKYRFIDLLHKLWEVHEILDKMENDVKFGTAWMIQ